MNSKQVRITIFGILISVAISTPVIQFAGLITSQLIFFTLLNFVGMAFISILYFRVLESFEEHKIYNEIAEWCVLATIVFFPVVFFRFLNGTLASEVLGIFIEVILLVLMIWLCTFYISNKDDFTQKKFYIWLIALGILFVIGLIFVVAVFVGAGKPTYQPITDNLLNVTNETG